MAKILQMRNDHHHNIGGMTHGRRETEETAAQIVALMQAKFSRPTPKEMLEILNCSADQICSIGH